MTHNNICLFSLEVRKIPVDMNTIDKLNGHFSQFGQVTNIQVIN